MKQEGRVRLMVSWKLDAKSVWVIFDQVFNFEFWGSYPYRICTTESVILQYRHYGFYRISKFNDPL